MPAEKLYLHRWKLLSYGPTVVQKCQIWRLIDTLSVEHNSSKIETAMAKIAKKGNQPMISRRTLKTLAQLFQVERLHSRMRRSWHSPFKRQDFATKLNTDYLLASWQCIYCNVIAVHRKNWTRTRGEVISTSPSFSSMATSADHRKWRQIHIFRGVGTRLRSSCLHCSVQGKRAKAIDAIYGDSIKITVLISSAPLGSSFEPWYTLLIAAIE